MDFKEYFESQTIKFHSSEMGNKPWADGQTRYLELYFKNLDKNLSILDVACGDGVGLQWFKENQFVNVTGIEFSVQKAEAARKQGYPVIEDDIHKLSFTDNSFDVVFSSHTIEHCHTPSLALKEIYRILKPDGTFYLILPYPDTGHDEAHLGKFELKTTVEDEGVSLVSYLESLNFKIIEKVFDGQRQPEIWLIVKKQ